MSKNTLDFLKLTASINTFQTANDPREKLRKDRCFENVMSDRMRDVASRIDDEDLADELECLADELEIEEDKIPSRKRKMSLDDLTATNKARAVEEEKKLRDILANLVDEIGLMLEYEQDNNGNTREAKRLRKMINNIIPPSMRPYWFRPLLSEKDEHED